MTVFYILNNENKLLCLYLILLHPPSQALNLNLSLNVGKLPDAQSLFHIFVQNQQKHDPY